jgi:bis(5'-nucleosidyl)-tetraphosphatase
MRAERCAGFIPLCKGQVYLIRSKKRDLWCFPKGHLESGENDLQAATRELQEETNLKVNFLLDKTPLEMSYFRYKKERLMV